MLPIIQEIKKTKASLQTIDLPDQQIVLSGNIAVTISGSLNFRVVDPGKAILSVQDYTYSVKQLALTTISDVLGTKTIEQVRIEKASISKDIEAIITQTAEEWGLADVDIRLTDARLDVALLRAMMRETEAKKEASAILIKAEADKRVASIFADAAKTLATSPGAMTLRILQAMNDLSNNKSTVVIPLPVDFMSALGNGRTGRLPTALGGDTPSHKSSVVTALRESHPRVENGIAVADCPNCGAKFNVSDIMGDKGYDARPDVTGQQIKCSKCKTDFTLLPIERT